MLRDKAVLVGRLLWTENAGSPACKQNDMGWHRHRYREPAQQLSLMENMAIIQELLLNIKVIEN